MGCADSQTVVEAEVYLRDSARELLNTFREHSNPLAEEPLVIDSERICDGDRDDFEVNTSRNDIKQITSDEKNLKLLKIKEIFMAKENKYNNKNKVVLENSTLIKKILREIAKVDNRKK